MRGTKNGQILPYQNFPGIQSMIFSKRTIRTTSVPKIRKIHSGLWKLKAKIFKTVHFGQKWPNFGHKWPNLAISEFSRHIHYDFLKEDQRVVFIPKIMKIYSGVWKIQAKNSKNCQFWPKNGQIFVLNGQNFAKSEFSWHIQYDFLKEDHKNNLHTKNQED